MSSTVQAGVDQAERAPYRFFQWYAKRPNVRLLVRVGAQFLVAAGDLVALATSAVVAALLRYGSLFGSQVGDVTLVLAPTMLLLGIASGGYSLDIVKHWPRSVTRAMFALVMAAGLGFALAFALQVGNVYSRLETGYLLALAALGLIFWRLMLPNLFHRAEMFLSPHVLILGLLPFGVVPEGTFQHFSPDSPPDIRDQQSVEYWCRKLRDWDRVVLAFDDPTERAEWAAFVRVAGIDAEILDTQLFSLQVLGLRYLNRVPTIVVARGPLTPAERALKRAFDIVVATALLVLCAPLLLILMCLIRLDSPGAAIFAQPRVGRNNLLYTCYKLRTMRIDAADVNGERSTSRADLRITRLGGFLRRTSLDELPQLWNVIKGDMSLVGPRPHALASTAEGKLFWDVVPNYWTRHSMRPGITGLAQVRGLRGATMSRADIEQRVAADMEYVNSWSFWQDIRILMRTASVVLHRNAF